MYNFSCILHMRQKILTFTSINQSRPNRSPSKVIPNSFPSLSRPVFTSNSSNLTSCELIDYRKVSTKIYCDSYNSHIREHIVNIDDSLMLHQFSIHFFYCFSTLKSMMFRRVDINDSSMKHQ